MIPILRTWRIITDPSVTDPYGSSQISLLRNFADPCLADPYGSIRILPGCRLRRIDFHVVVVPFRLCCSSLVCCFRLFVLSAVFSGLASTITCGPSCRRRSLHVLRWMSCRLSSCPPSAFGRLVGDGVGHPLCRPPRRISNRAPRDKPPPRTDLCGPLVDHSGPVFSAVCRPSCVGSLVGVVPVTSCVGCLLVPLRLSVLSSAMVSAIPYVAAVMHFDPSIRRRMSSDGHRPTFAHFWSQFWPRFCMVAVLAGLFLQKFLRQYFFSKLFFPKVALRM